MGARDRREPDAGPRRPGPEGGLAGRVGFASPGAPGAAASRQSAPRRDRRFLRVLRALVVVGVPLLIAACASSGVISADSTGIAIEHGEGGPNPKLLAIDHCAKLGLKPQLIAVEPMSFVSQIFYYSCV